MTAAAPVRLHCPRCQTPWPAEAVELAALERCPRCETGTCVTLFPAFTRPPDPGRAAETTVLEGEATCFYHPQKRAHVPCDACGRFLCALCDLELNGQHLCPACLESGAKKGRFQSLERERTRWDQIVWSVLLLPLVLCGLALPVTSLAAMVLLGWKWNAPGSLMDNSRLSFTLAAVTAAVEFIAGVAFWWFLFTSKSLL